MPSRGRGKVSRLQALTRHVTGTVVHAVTVMLQLLCPSKCCHIKLAGIPMPCHSQVMADIEEEKVTDKSTRHIISRDGDPTWFNNPQFVRGAAVVDSHHDDTFVFCRAFSRLSACP